MSDRTVALVGLGNMGTPMAARLVAGGHAVVGVDPHPVARARLAAQDGRAVAHLRHASADVVLLLLPDSGVVEAVLGEALEEGLLGPGTTVVDMSSSDPERTRALAPRLAEAGVAFADAPVSGGVGGAEAGTLTIMFGGTAEVLADVTPLLSELGTVRHVGPVGAGHAVKALNNLVSAVHLWATSEAVILAGRYGVTSQAVLDVLNGSSGRSGSSEAKWPKFILPGSFDSGFSAALMLKDIRTATGLAAASGLPTALGETLEQLWSGALATLPAGADHTEIARVLTERADGLS